MTPSLFRELAVRPGLQLLPKALTSDRAEAMLLAIALQESRIRHRRQLHGGPARSYWQFEPIGVSGVMSHAASKEMARAVCDVLDIDPAVATVYHAMEFNDHLAVCLARLLLWTSPRRLPEPGETDYAWSEYLANWRPGKPHRATWDEHYARAWRLVREQE